MSVIPQNAPFFTQFVLLTLVKTRPWKSSFLLGSHRGGKSRQQGPHRRMWKDPRAGGRAGPNGLRQTAPKSAVSTRPGGQDRPQITLWDLTGKLSLCRAGSSRANQSIWAALGAAPRELPSGKFLKNVLPNSAPEDGPMDLLVFLPLVAGQEEAARPSECSVLAGAR